MSAMLEGMRQAFLREGLPENASIQQLVLLSPQAIHRLAYSALLLETVDRLLALRDIRQAKPTTRSGELLRDFETYHEAPSTLDHAWDWVEQYIAECLRPALEVADLATGRFILYMDTAAEQDRFANAALQLVRIVDLIHPCRAHIPGGPDAKTVENQDPLSIWAWYSRQLTSPMYIDSGAPDHNRISSGYIYSMPKGDDPARAVDDLNAMTRDLLEEAALLRQGSIPNAAMVEINAPPFVALCFAEIMPSLVVMEVLDSESRSLPIVYQPADRAWFGPNTGQGPTGSIESFDHVVAAMAMIGAAALRDFWVIEDRDRTLGPPRLDRVLGLKSSRRHVIYLPRIRYRSAQVASQNATALLSVAERRAHWRSAHFRKLPSGHHASRKQTLLAQAHGRIPPDGYTWIRGATVAGADVEAVYRSRSAVRALFDATPLQQRTHSGLTWFAFERAVWRWLEGQGFEELARKGGDRGADIWCCRARGDVLEFWVVQCKHVRKPVGPEAVRELHGAAALRQADRAMLVTSSAFTLGALETARDLGIDLVDGTQIMQ